MASATYPRGLNALPSSACRCVIRARSALTSRQGQLRPQPAEARAPERDGTAVETRQVSARARGESGPLLLRGQTGSVVLDRDRQAAVVGAARRRDAAPGPFARVVHQVAEHLLEVLLLTAEHMIDRDVDREL